MSAIEIEGAPRFERRIGERVELEPTAVAWVQAQPRRRFRRDLPPVERAGQIRNVSITGAAIDGPAELPWQPGSTAVIRTGGSDNLVVVRHRSPLENGTVRYGVQLTPASNGLRRRISDAVEPLLAPAPPKAGYDGPMLSMQRPPAPPRRTPDALDELLAAAAAPAPEAVVDLRRREVLIDLTDATLGLVPPTPIRAAPLAPPVVRTGPDPVPTLRAVPDWPTTSEPSARTEGPAPIEMPTIPERADTTPSEPTSRAAGPAGTDPRDGGPAVGDAPAPPTILDDIFGLMED